MKVAGLLSQRFEVSNVYTEYFDEILIMNILKVHIMLFCYKSI